MTEKGKQGEGKTALITGATSGIGREFVRVLAQRGYRLILVGRRHGRLEEIKESVSVPVRIITADLSQESQCRQLLHDLDDEQIDLFINDAGFGDCGRFVRTSLDKDVSMIHVNIIAMHILFKGILKKMTARGTHGSGQILNVASAAGLMPGGPFMATYYATKAYVTSLTRAVSVELREMHSHVHVSALCPGPVNTEFNEHADVVFALKGISAQQCVREAMAGLAAHRLIIVPSFTMKIAMAGQRFLPACLTVRLAGMQQKRKMG